MEILQFLLSFFLKEYGGAFNNIVPIIESLRENSFDLKKTLSSLNPEVLEPILKTFASGFGGIKNNDGYPKDNRLSPIINIADKEIVYALNRYLE